MCEIISAGLKVIAGDMFLSFSTVHVAYYSANILNECTGVKQKILGATRWICHSGNRPLFFAYCCYFWRQSVFTTAVFFFSFSFRVIELQLNQKLKREGAKKAGSKATKILKTFLSSEEESFSVGSAVKPPIME